MKSTKEQQKYLMVHNMTLPTLFLDINDAMPKQL